jgi:hypothetical protein
MMHKLEIMPKLWDNTIEIGKMPAGETRSLINLMGLNI